MSTEAGTGTETAVPSDGQAPNDRPGFRTGRSGLVVAGILAAIGIYLAVGIATMDVPDGAKSPGPTFFPTLITVAIFVLATLLAVQTLRNPENTSRPTAGQRYYTDWKSLGIVFASFLAFTLMLVPVGWILSAAVLFWGVSHALGSRRPLYDLGLSLVFASTIQLAFGAGLGLNLPGGILEGIYG